MEKLFFRTRKIDVPNYNLMNEKKYWKRSIKNNAFNVMFTAGFFVGLPLSSSIIKENKNDVHICIKIWCYAMAAVKTIMFLVTLAYINQFLPGLSISVTFYGYNVCGYLTMIIFIRNRKKMYKATQNLIYLSSVMIPGEYIGSRSIMYQLVIFFAFVILLMFCVALFLFCEQREYYTHALYVPYFIPESLRESYWNFVSVSFVTTFGLSVSVSGFFYILSINLYGTLEKLVSVYAEKLKERSQRTAWNVETLPDDISVFKNIALRINEIDLAINMYVFFFCGAMISALFNAVSVLASNNEFYNSTYPKIYIVFIFISWFVTFFVMARHGTNIIDKGEEAKLRMVEYLDKFLRYSPSHSAMQLFNFLFEVVMKIDVKVTGGGMFVINYGLILSICSVMVTYGVLILQLDQK
ncbi:hypothetical protein AVEN_152598-1 [Araneus ventricosus]|uniref:Gustatory receptor n=1 Tax=Araneus ventricosus TaxID=182803 RepID=A0A4Y2FYR8_ARAVE|nr:hypothetical protein AVEN_152598-1 [Araneus ventricosus]